MTVVNFSDESLRSSTFRNVDLGDSRFTMVDLSGTQIRAARLGNVHLRGVDFFDSTIDGEIQNLVINGVDVAPLIEAELDRRDPERVMMRPADADGFRAAWPIIERRWAETVEHARRLPPERLHASVDDEWSFIQTLRHLVYATDVWIHRVMLGDPNPFDPLSLPFDEADPHPDVPWDRDARPELDTVLALRRNRMSSVIEVLDQLTDEQLAGFTEPVDGPSWPPADRYPVREALLTVLNEEWQHRIYAERDLAALEARQWGDQE